jgi:hypothetical protein
MKKLINTSQIVASLMAMAAALAIVPDIAGAGPAFDPHMAQGGLPACMAELNSAASELEASHVDLIQVQTELATCQANVAVSSGTLGIPRTGQTSMYAAGDDGDLQMGVPLTDPRFTDNDDGTVTDNLTGLTWTKSANLSAKSTWDTALDVCYNLTADGIDLNDGSLPGDWRLPNIREMQSMIDYGRYNPALTADHTFTDLQSTALSYYWTSTTYAGYNIFAWGLTVINGSITQLKKTGQNGYVWCVRGGE